jgi:hypothetical protein
MSKNRGTGMKKLWIGVCILALAALACNINVATPSSQAGLATIVAQTMQAVMSETTSPPPLNTPVEASTPSATQTAVKAILTIHQNTNCRSGPGSNSNIITAFTPGTTLEIVGKDTADDFWLVKVPNTSDTCWASGQYATPSGGYASLPEVTPTASTPQGVPDAPGFLINNGWTFFCYGTGQTDITLNWDDRANNETGYRIYRNGNVVAELPANSTSYAETITLLSGQSVSYQIEAFNPSGAARSGVATMTCP